MNFQLWLPLAATLIIMGAIFFVVKDGSATATDRTEEAPVRTEPVADEQATAIEGGEGWRNIGSLFIVLGGFGMALSLFMKTSIQTVGVYGASDVVNLGLMFNKGVAIAVSLFAIGLGVFCVAVGAIVRAITSRASE